MFLTLNIFSPLLSLCNCNYIPDNLNLSKWPICSLCASFPPFINLANCSCSTFNFINLFFCHCLSVVILSSECVCVCVNALKAPTKMLNPLKLELQSAVSCLIWVLDTKLRSFGRAASALTLPSEPSLQTEMTFSHQYSQPLGNLEYIIKYTHFLKVNKRVFSLITHT